MVNFTNKLNATPNGEDPSNPNLETVGQITSSPANLVCSQIITVDWLLHINSCREKILINGPDFGCTEHPAAEAREDPDPQ